MLEPVRRWRAWAAGRGAGRARLARARPAGRMALLLAPRAGGAPAGAPAAPRAGAWFATHLHLAAGPGRGRPGAPGRPGGRGRPGDHGPAGERAMTLLARAARAPSGGRVSGAGGPAGAPSPPAPAVRPRPVPRTLAAGPRGRSGRAAAPVRPATGTLVARVAGAHRRIERPARGAAGPRQPAGPVVAAEHAVAAGQRPAGPPAEPPPPATAKPPPGGPGGMPPVDLDQLTDQIVTRLDHRLIAHRERFGRVS